MNDAVSNLCWLCVSLNVSTIMILCSLVESSQGIGSNYHAYLKLVFRWHMLNYLVLITNPCLLQLIVWAPTREKAIERMKRALNDTIITGKMSSGNFTGELLILKSLQ